jgi:hypothetical protein
MIPEAIYTIDWNIFLQMYVAGIRQRPKHTELLLVFISKIADLQQELQNFRNESVYKVSHNASVGLLEKVMNDKFDQNQRRIYIRNVQRIEDLRLYTFPQEKQIGIRTDTPVGLRTGSIFNPESPDFKVFIPLDIQPVNATELEGLIIQIRAQLDYYKLYAKKYELVWNN